LGCGRMGAAAVSAFALALDFLAPIAGAVYAASKRAP
jgi:hypothetical protein